MLRPQVGPPQRLTQVGERVAKAVARMAQTKDGSIKDATILRGHPMLNQAALDAVQQWRYSPTLLNNEPVEVLLTVTVNFTLQ